jgi:hypothetical protein
MTALYALGALGLLLLVSGLLFGDDVDGFLDSAFDALDAGPGLTAALGAALTAVGFGGALLAAPFGLLAGTLLGLALGVGVGVATVMLVRLALGGQPEAAPSSTAMLGLFGTVVSGIPDDGYGEISLSVGGTRVKVSGRSAVPLDAGTSVYVTEVISDTSVVVARAHLLT